MRTVWLIGIAIVCLALPAAAQQRQREGEQNRPRVRRSEGPPREGEPAGLRRVGPIEMAQRLAERLELTDAQREQYDAIVAKYTEQWEQQRSHTDEVRALARQYREAREAGDEDRANEIRKQMQEQRGGHQQGMQQFLDEVEPILDEQQVERLSAFRSRMQQLAPERSGRGAAMWELMQNLPQELELNEEQMAQYEVLMAERRAELEKMREQWRELTPLREELRAARQAGDEQRAAELQAQLEEKRAEPPDPMGFLEKLMPILTDAQKTKLAELRERVSARDEQTLDVRAVLQAAKRLKLNEEQSERLKEINREAQAAQSQGRMDKEARAALAQTVKAQIIEMLDANQANELERMLERVGRSGRPEGERHGDRERGDQPRGEGRGGHGRNGP